VHVLTVRTKYTFDDHVRFDSRAQGQRGSGTVFAISIDADGNIFYTIRLDERTDFCMVDGVYEDEITGKLGGS